MIQSVPDTAIGPGTLVSSYMIGILFFPVRYCSIYR